MTITVLRNTVEMVVRIDPVTLPDVGLVTSLDIDIYFPTEDEPGYDKPSLLVAMRGQDILPSGRLSTRKARASLGLVRPGRPGYEEIKPAVEAALALHGLTLEGVDW
jgi:hypothetical protein